MDLQLISFCKLLGEWQIRDVQPTAEGESQKVKVKVRVNIHGIITVASASLVEKKQDAQNESIEMENANDNAQGQDAAMDTNGSSQDQQNGPENQEVRDDEMKGEPQQKQSWTQKVGSWFSGVRVGSACVQLPCCLLPAAILLTTLCAHSFCLTSRY